MATNTKITLSEEEQVLLLDTAWILTKKNILEKVSLILASQTETISRLFANKDSIPRFIWDNPPKISKGEQYLGLPYQILDYPRYFTREETFAIRTFFWWGQYFSVTLQTSGSLNKTILDNVKLRSGHFPEGLFVYVGQDPWNHDLSSPDYVLPDHEHFNRIMQTERSFYKLSVRIDLKDWELLPQKLTDAYSWLSACIA